MKKTYYNESKQPVRVENNAYPNRAGHMVLNVECLSAERMAEYCGLYTYEPQTTMTKNGKPAKYGKLVINKSKGTCTHELIELTEAEIAQHQEDALRTEFEAEMLSKKEAEFLDWKKSKTIKK